jgi:CubicO group peptidase (beta-lactamase class C family)
MNTTYKKILAAVSILVVLTGMVTPLQATTQLSSLDTTQEATRLPDTLFDQKISVLMRLAGFLSLSTCIINDDTIIWSKGYGYYDLGEKKQATIDTIYVLASITKTIVGTALMQLYEQGLFDLDDDVNMFLPFDLRNPNYPDDPITFRMLLSHTSSLNTNTQRQYYWFNFSGDPPFPFFPEPYLQEFLVPGGSYYDQSVWSTRYRPGQRAMYANVGFDLISYLVELISGEPFLQYCDTHIFAPLDMKNTSFNLSTLDIAQVAIPYQRFAGRYHHINELGFIFGDYTPPEIYWRGRFYPAGGLYSTVSDLSHFLIAHMNEGVYNGTRILKKETVELMHEMQPGNNIGYGLAWMHTAISPRLTASGHAGDLHGVDTWMLSTSAENMGVIYLANGNPAYSLSPLKGLFVCRILLYSLFTKQGTFTGGTYEEFNAPSEMFFLRSLMTPHPLFYQAK